MIEVVLQGAVLNVALQGEVVRHEKLAGTMLPGAALPVLDIA